MGAYADLFSFLYTLYLLIMVFIYLFKILYRLQLHYYDKKSVEILCLVYIKLLFKIMIFL